MTKCAVLGCSSESSRGCGLGFYRFPSKEDKRKIWIENINRSGWTPGIHARVCSNHFLDGKPTEANPDPAILISRIEQTLALTSPTKKQREFLRKSGYLEPSDEKIDENPPPLKRLRKKECGISGHGNLVKGSLVHSQYQKSKSSDIYYRSAGITVTAPTPGYRFPTNSSMRVLEHGYSSAINDNTIQRVVEHGYNSAANDQPSTSYRSGTLISGMHVSAADSSPVDQLFPIDRSQLNSQTIVFKNGLIGTVEQESDKQFLYVNRPITAIKTEQIDYDSDQSQDLGMEEFDGLAGHSQTSSAWICCVKDEVIDGGF